MLDKLKWGGSGIERCTFDFILEHIPQGSRVLELGAGFCSTPALAEYYDLTSIEHQEEYAKHPNTCLLNITDGWYDLKELANILTHDYELIFIDGVNRAAFLQNIDMFKNIKSVLIHDTYRPTELGLAYLVAEKLNKNLYINKEGDHFAYIL